MCDGECMYRSETETGVCFFTISYQRLHSGSSHLEAKGIVFNVFSGNYLLRRDLDSAAARISPRSTFDFRLSRRSLSCQVAEQLEDYSVLAVLLSILTYTLCIHACTVSLVYLKKMPCYAQCFVLILTNCLIYSMNHSLVVIKDW
jgi:hypothetical protein